MPKATMKKVEKLEGKRDGRANDKGIKEEKIGITEEVETRNREQETT
jgi:hypothetical protein